MGEWILSDREIAESLHIKGFAGVMQRDRIVAIAQARKLLGWLEQRKIGELVGSKAVIIDGDAWQALKREVEE